MIISYNIINFVEIKILFVRVRKVGYRKQWHLLLLQQLNIMEIYPIGLIHTQ